MYQQYHVHGICSKKDLVPLISSQLYMMLHQDHVSPMSGPLLTVICEVEEGEVLLPPSGGRVHMHVVFHWYLEFAGKTGIAS